MPRKTAVIAGCAGGLAVLVAVAVEALGAARSSGPSEHDEIVRALCASQSPDKPDELTEFIIDRDPSEHTNNMGSDAISSHVENLMHRARGKCPERFNQYDAIVRRAEQESKEAEELARESERLNEDEPDQSNDALASGSGVPGSLSELGGTESDWNTFQAVALETNYIFDPSDSETSEGRPTSVRVGSVRPDRRELDSTVSR